MLSYAMSYESQSFPYEAKEGCGEKCETHLAEVVSSICKTGVFTQSRVHN